MEKDKDAGLSGFFWLPDLSLLLACAAVTGVLEKSHVYMSDMVMLHVVVIQHQYCSRDIL